MTQVLPAFQPNTIYCGDCLDVLNGFSPESADLIYIDPPFGSGEDYEVVFRDGVEVRHFKDRWIGGKPGYIDWMRPRVRAIHTVLKRTGSFYLHCDHHLNAHLRILCDEIFGEGNFQNEIIWKRKDAQSFTSRYGVVNDTILFYTKSDDYTFNKGYTDLSQETSDNWYSKEEIAQADIVNKLGKTIKAGTVRYVNYADMSAPGPRVGTRVHYKWRGKLPPPGRHWQHTIDVMRKLEADGLIHYSAKSGKPYQKRYKDESKGVPYNTIWSDISMLRGMSKHSKDSEYLGFPTQKPIPLLRRIIEVSSNPGDIVLDPMCGCGTTLGASLETGRRWVGVDISPTACRVMVNGLHKRGVKITEDSIIGLPRTANEIRRMVQIDPIEFQNWVCERLNAVSTTPKGNAPRADKNVDGWIMNTTPIQVKGSDGVGYDEVQRFETTLRTLHTGEGYVVAFSFSKPAYSEAFRAKNTDGLNIDLLELEEVRTPNPDFPHRPEVHTVLKSNVTGQVWGART
jgi:DNA modification methylase